MAQSFDAIIIGAGQSGPSLAVRLARSGLKTLLVEREHLGGTCVNDGCIPTKTLVASARTAHVARRAAEYGVTTGPVTVDMKAVKARKDKLVEASKTGLADWIGATANLTLVWGEARFTGPRRIAVAGQEYEAARVFLNVGARPVVPDWPGIGQTPYLTNTSIMDLDVVPEHLIIAGGSYIGLEFAQMYRRFGARVTVLEQGERIIAREDEDVSRTIAEILKGEGIEILTRVAGIAVGPHGAGVRVELTSGGQPAELTGSHLLVAVGRRPNTDGLGLDLAGVAVDARGYITVDDDLRTSAEGVWATGDVNGRGGFTHTSYNDFEIVAANLLDGDARRVSDRLPAYALFVDPPLGRVGMTEAQAKAAGHKVLRGLMPMSRVGRAKERGETQGFMKILVDADSKLILGAAMLCIEGDEIVHSVLDVMAAKAPYTVIQRGVHIHPTVSELIPTLLGDLKPLD